MNDKTPAASGAAPALPPLPASPLHRFTAHVYTAADMHTYALAALASREADMQEAKDLIEHLDIENHWLRQSALASPQVAPAPDLSKLTDEQIADAVECEFSETGEWPEGDAATFRAILKHAPDVMSFSGVDKGDAS